MTMTASMQFWWLGGDKRMAARITMLHYTDVRHIAKVAVDLADSVILQVLHRSRNGGGREL